MNNVVLHFETYFDSSYRLEKLTIPEYVHDPRFRVHGLAIYLPDGTLDFRQDAEDALHQLRAQFGDQLEKTTVMFHCAHFQAYVLNHIYGIRPRFFVDTVSLANNIHGSQSLRGNVYQLNTLAGLYELNGCRDREFLCGASQLDCRQAAELARLAKHEVFMTRKIAHRLLAKLERPEVELLIMMHTIRLLTERGVCVDLDGLVNLGRQIAKDVRKQLESAGIQGDEIKQDKVFHARLASALCLTGRSLPMKHGTRGLIPATAKADRDMQALCQDADPLVARLAVARLGKRSGDQRLAGLQKLRSIATAAAGVLPVQLIYCGSHTGRFSGGGGLNIQNLPKSGFGAGMRKLLVPRPGHKFVIADLSQIESRVLAWLANECILLDAYSLGRDVYSEFATLTLHRQVRKPTADDPPAEQKRLTALREVGKQAILGLGYQMGAKRFREQLLTNPLLSDLVESGFFTIQRCAQIVERFRSQYPNIPLLWRGLERVLRGAINGQFLTLPLISVGLDGRDTRVRLPSGRSLKFKDLRLGQLSRVEDPAGAAGPKDSEFSRSAGLIYGDNSTLYGGKACENIVQALARDIFVEAVLRLEKEGFRVLFHVHDEVVIEVPVAELVEAEARIKRILTECPAWAAGLPLSCDVQCEESYK